jgi:esterase/lipase superfamily enzyme
MGDDETLVRSLARDFILFAVLPCALLTGAAYLYMEYFSPPLYAGVKLQDDVIYVSARRFETHGLEMLAANGAAIDLKPWSTLAVDRGLTPNVTVLVHGYNAQEHKVAGYFADLISHLHADAQHKVSIIVFDWPAVGVPHDELPTGQRLQRDLHMFTKNSPSQPGYELSMYAIDQRRAESVGAQSLLALLASLSDAGDRTVNVVAHSMGCHLLMHAMQQNPEAFSRVASMTWLAPDVDAAVIDEPWFRNAIEKLRRGLSVHYSHNDTMLTRLSRVANQSPRLGATGAGSSSAPPRKMEFVDMTAELGIENVHAGYLLRGSASARLIARQIVEAR